MLDYEKLTVVKLRDELVARGLSKTGLKAALVLRLIEADALSEKADLAANEHSEISKEDESANAVVSELQALRGPKDDGHAVDDAPQSKKQDKDKDKVKVADVADEDEPRNEPDVMVRSQLQTRKVQEAEQLEEQASHRLIEPSGYVLTQNGTQNEELSEKRNENAKQPEIQLPSPVQTQTGEGQVAENKSGLSTQTLLTGDEILEDSRKRKRRSQSPPPSSMENTQKKLKADNGRPLVELPEDSMAESTNPEERPNDVWSPPDPTYARESDAQPNGHTSTSGESKVGRTSTSATIGQIDTDRMSRSQTESSALEEMGPPKEKISTPTQVKSVEPPLKSSPSDTQFKHLFTASANLEPASQQSNYPDAEDKIVSPALHPATSALYIRELMRPLKIESLRDHLIALATPPDTAVNPDIVKDFFLDSVRTHCLVGFENISAASRVRSGLHDRIWPNERDRRQLWVDFVPEERLKNWIDVEQTAGSGRGHPSKRWEVVYEDAGNGIKAYLQEVGSMSGGFRAAQPPRMDAGQGVQTAPSSGPRTSGSESRSSQTKLDGGKGFQALDDLFTSTAAKPKLYYLPVSKAEADRRLAKLAAGRGG
ncbi:MAG: hypothetical protein Q9175_007962, partial [Cornicularia normoerica]